MTAVEPHAAADAPGSGPAGPEPEPGSPLDPDAGRFRPSPGGTVARVAVLAGIVALVLAMPPLLGSVSGGVYVPLVARAAVFGIMALSMNVLVGYTGQVSLGHNAFLGVGAFGAGYALSTLEMPWFGAVLVAAATGAVGALILGGVALRLSGLYLALVTIAYGGFAQNTLFKVRSLTGGGAGTEAPRPSGFTSNEAYAYLCLAVLGLALAFDWRLVSSKAGRAIRALRDDERVAASWGINVTGYKLMAFVISGILAGVGGAMFAGIEQVVSAEDFGFTLALTFLLMTVVGGAGNRWGVVQGGVLFAILPTLLDRGHANFGFFPFTVIEATWEPAIEAVLLVLTLMFFPGGIAQQQRHLLSWLSFGRWRIDREDETPAPEGTTRP